LKRASVGRFFKPRKIVVSAVGFALPSGLKITLRKKTLF
jgi:hypothetical protein